MLLKNFQNPLTGTKAPIPACQGPPSPSTGVGLVASASPGAAFQLPNSGILDPTLLDFNLIYSRNMGV